MLSSKSCSDSRLARELRITAPIGRGRSKGAKLVQEYLSLNGISVVIDGDLGTATETGIADFCAGQGIAKATAVDQGLMDRLAQPLLRAVRQIAGKSGLGETVVAIAKQHLAEHPLEIGGPNRGPWVRLYMNGSEGQEYAWCAGLVTYVVTDAAKAHGRKTPITRTFSCDRMAIEAIAEGRYTKRISPSNATAGSVFLVPHGGNANDWTHTGIISGGDGNVFRTIEGNTNDEGSREGFEVCARIRSCANVDVITL